MIRRVKIESVGCVAEREQLQEEERREKRKKVREMYINTPLSLLWTALLIGFQLSIVVYIVTSGFMLAIAPFLT